MINKRKHCGRKPLPAWALRRATLAMLLVVLGFGNLCAQSMPQKDGDKGTTTDIVFVLDASTKMKDKAVLGSTSQIVLKVQANKEYLHNVCDSYMGKICYRKVNNEYHRIKITRSGSIGAYKYTVQDQVNLDYVYQNQGTNSGTVKYKEDLYEEVIETQTSTYSYGDLMLGAVQKFITDAKASSANYRIAVVTYAAEKSSEQGSTIFGLTNAASISETDIGKLSYSTVFGYTSTRQASVHNGLDKAKGLLTTTTNNRAVIMISRGNAAFSSSVSGYDFTPLEGANSINKSRTDLKNNSIKVFTIDCNYNYTPDFVVGNPANLDQVHISFLGAISSDYPNASSDSDDSADIQYFEKFTINLGDKATDGNYHLKADLTSSDGFAAVLQQAANAASGATSWADNVTQEPPGYDRSNINSPEAFVWSLKQNDVANLKADIDLSSHPWKPIENYTGTFNGNGHVITGLTNKKDGSPVTEPGMFANIKTGGMVKNIIVKNCEFVANKPDNFFGIIANEMTGGTVSGCEVLGTVSGNGKWGGIAGQVTGGTVSGCISMANGTNGALVHTLGSGATLEKSYATQSTTLWNTATGTVSHCYGINSEKTGGTYYESASSSFGFTYNGFGYGGKGCYKTSGGARLVDKYGSIWAQPCTTSINNGFLVLKREGSFAMAQDADGFLHYGDLPDLINAGTVFFYGKKDYTAEASMTYDGDNLYIDENAALKVNGSVKAHTSRFIANTNPNAKDATAWWHHYASPMNEAATGITYENEEKHNYDVSCVPQLSDALFPSGIEYTTQWDLYSYYEPAYHWLNFKRNKASHYMEGTHEYIVPDGLQSQYKLRNGEGYLIALASESYIQSTGTLNHDEITKPVTVSNLSSTPGANLSGFNLLGNPYQCYLSFKAFAQGNAGLWDGTATYLTYNPEGDYYTQGTMETASTGSAAATGDINMNQGFFIVVNHAANAVFNYSMCFVEPEGDVHFRGEKFAYPLINLVARDSEGVGDVAVVEFDRPEFAAAPKMFNYGGMGKVYFRYGDDDNALLFLDEDTDQLPVRFAAFEDAEYTLSWTTANANFSYLHLIDNMTGADIDMLTRDSYTFSAKSTDYTSRFRLMFAYTGIGENEGTELVEVFAFLHDGNLVVNGQGRIDVIDLNGRSVIAKQLYSEQNSIGLPNLTSGVYVVRLTNNNESKVQKIIIK